MIRRLKIFLLLSALFTISLSSTAVAQPSEVGLDAFSPETVTIDFDDYAVGQPTIPGLTVNAIAAGSWSVGEGSEWGTTSDPGRQYLGIGGPIELIFDERAERVGFYFGGNTANNVPIEIRRDGSSSGSFTLTSVSGPADGVTNWYFVGFEDPDGIDSIVFGEELNSDWFYGIYDLMLDNGEISNEVVFKDIPTLNPWGMIVMTLLLFGVGMAAFRRFA